MFLFGEHWFSINKWNANQQKPSVDYLSYLITIGRKVEVELETIAGNERCITFFAIGRFIVLVLLYMRENKGDSD